MEKPDMTAEQGERWKQRAMELDRKLGWIRHELRMSDHLTTTKRWREEALAMLTETDDELRVFLESIK
jgi:hypothetical protein